MSANEKILVTGATGQLGSLIVQHLRRRAPGAQVIAGGRRTAAAPAGVEFRTVDYDRPETLEAALDGITRVVLVSGSEVGKRVAQHRNVIEAAARAGVKLLAYTSILKADSNPMKLAEEHRGTEQVLAGGKVPYIVLRNGWYSENYTGSAAVAVQSGVLQSASGKGRISTATRNDYAEGAAALVLRDDHRAGQAYELAGSTSFDKHEYAQMLSKASGRRVAVQELSEEAYAQALMKAGLPEPFARILADSDARSGDGWLFDDSRTLEQAIGRPTTPMEETVRAALDAG
ncbi:MAG: SDR family oxidoreductase [Pseudomonadota bacterium]|jgi:NAD(P)H dehydrogenase (quinone)